MSTNPYQPPAIPSEPTTPPDARSYRLYSSGHVGWATFLGSPLAGCVLLALNYLRLGDASSAWLAVGGGTVFTAGLLVVSMFLPEAFPTFVLPLACTFGIIYLAKALQGPALEQHLAQGGPKGSGWIATGVGILTAVVVLGLFIAVLLMLPESWLPE